MSTIWTPGGEHPVPPHQDEQPEQPTLPDEGMLGEDIDPEVAEQLAGQLAEAQQRIRSEPIEVVVSNHVMGLYELAALHLTDEPPNLEAARLPIDAMGLLVENLGDRLAEHATLTSTLQQIRMAYVQMAEDDEAEAEE